MVPDDYYQLVALEKAFLLDFEDSEEGVNVSPEFFELRKTVLRVLDSDESMRHATRIYKQHCKHLQRGALSKSDFLERFIEIVGTEASSVFEAPSVVVNKIKALESAIKSLRLDVMTLDLPLDIFTDIKGHAPLKSAEPERYTLNKVLGDYGRHLGTLRSFHSDRKADRTETKNKGFAQYCRIATAEFYELTGGYCASAVEYFLFEIHSPDIPRLKKFVDERKYNYNNENTPR